MENKIEISDAFLLDILKQQKFRFTLNEIDAIISPKLKEELLRNMFGKSYHQKKVI